MPNFENGNNGARRVGLDDANSGRRQDMRSLPDDLRESALIDLKEAAEHRDRLIAPPRILEPRCNVCKHPYRDFIETMLVRGHTYVSIAERISPHVDRRSISVHFNKHMDLQDTALRAIIEEEAKLQGENFEEGVRDAITKRSVLEIALRKGYRDIVNNVTTVEPRDLIQIAKLLADMDSHQTEVAIDEMRAQFAIFIMAIKNVCEPEIQNLISKEVKKLRSSQGLGAQIENAMDEPKSIEATVENVEEEIVYLDVKRIPIA